MNLLHMHVATADDRLCCVVDFISIPHTYHVCSDGGEGC